MAQTVIFAEQELTFTDGGGFYFWQAIPAPISLVNGQTYIVEWNGEQHICVAQNASFSGMDGIGIGNLAIAGIGDNTNEPFLIGNTVDGSFMLCLTMETDATARMAIYQVTAEKGIVLKDRDGSPVTHPGAIGVKMLNTNGEMETFIPGEAEEKTVVLDFSDGDMEVLPGDGKLLTKVDIPKPENLIPDNIAKDVNIAGVVGTMESGGTGNVKWAYACVTTTPAYSTSGKQSLTPSVTIPSSATILSVLTGVQAAQASNQAAVGSDAVTAVSETTSYGYSVSGDSMTVSATQSFTKTSRNYCRASAVIIVIYTE